MDAALNSFALIALISVALIFDGLNGLHDAANSIATVVSTRVLRPQYAVIWAAFFNFIAFLFFGLHVAQTVGTGIVAANVVDGVQEVTINTLDYGYQPSYFSARSGQPIRLKLETNNTYGCTRSFVIPSQGIRRILPETGETVIDIPAQQPGYLRFTCGMGMYGGVISVQASSPS